MVTGVLTLEANIEVKAPSLKCMHDLYFFKLQNYTTCHFSQKKTQLYQSNITMHTMVPDTGLYVLD